MYAMVNAFANVYMNINQAYMAGLMTAPMVLIEMAVMRRRNVMIATASMIVLASCWMLIRHRHSSDSRAGMAACSTAASHRAITENPKRRETLLRTITRSARRSRTTTPHRQNATLSITDLRAEESSSRRADFFSRSTHASVAQLAVVNDS